MITRTDKTAVESFLIADAPLSGYLAGNPYGGAAVQRLEEMWATKFERQHAIACNSATSGLLAAALALGVDERTLAWVPSLSMSATVAIPKFLGSRLLWMDTDDNGGSKFEPTKLETSNTIVFLTSLFGHPPNVEWMDWKASGRDIILDNAQGVLASYINRDCWAENAGTITVTSFNVHKQINAGEGGMITTNDQYLSNKMRGIINHAEMNELTAASVGFNFRMTEISALLALSQLQRIDNTVFGLRKLCNMLDGIMPDGFYPVHPPELTNSGCYCYVFKVPMEKRDRIVEYLNNQGIPCSAMYRPLYHLPAFIAYDVMPKLPGTELFCREAIVFEICAWKYEDDIFNINKALAEASLL